MLKTNHCDYKIKPQEGLHAVGVRDEYIMKFGGWKSDGVLKAVYRGTLDDFEAAAAEKATGFFEKNANEMLTRP